MDLFPGYRIPQIACSVKMDSTLLYIPIWLESSPLILTISWYFVIFLPVVRLIIHSRDWQIGPALTLWENQIYCASPFPDQKWLILETTQSEHCFTSSMESGKDDVQIGNAMWHKCKLGSLCFDLTMMAAPVSYGKLLFYKLLYHFDRP